MTAEFSATLEAIVGERFVHCGADIANRYRAGIGVERVAAPAWLVKPADTEEVAAVMSAAHKAGVPVTVVGGQTGTCGGAIPSDDGLALSLERMDRVVEIDPQSMTMTVEAGCILQTAQELAEAQGALLPLDLGARGSATIGGVVATNAGGIRVIRWGMVRDMVLGLEVVLADGTVVSSLTKMIKDNAGYAWKHLMIGSEGTLGVVTRAVFRLRPLPTARRTALLGLPDFPSAIRVLRRLEVLLSGQVTSFELMWGDYYRIMTTAQLPQRPCPMPPEHAIYALVETMGADSEVEDMLFEEALAMLLDEGHVSDAVVAQSARERDALWAIREDLEPGFRTLRPTMSYDVSMAISDMQRFVDRCRAALIERFPDATVLFFGHAGDGNLHILAAVGELDETVKHAVDSAVYGTVREVGGSIAAEHGVGTTRSAWLGHSRSDPEMALMKTIRRALDPRGLLNPGKLFPLDTEAPAS